MALAWVRRVRNARDERDRVVVSAVGDPLTVESSRRRRVHRRVVVVHLCVLVLRVELDDGHARVTAVVHRIRPVGVEILSKDVLCGVCLPRARPSGDEGVSEREWIALGVVVADPVVDRRGRRRGTDALAADREVPEEDARLGDRQPGLDLRVVCGRFDHRAGFWNPVCHPATQLGSVLVHHRHRVELGDELVVALCELLSAHLPARVDLGGVVRTELLCVLERRDLREESLPVGVRHQQVGPEPNRIAVVRRNERPERGVVFGIGDPKSL